MARNYRRPNGAAYFTFRRRWPTIVAAGCGLAALWVVWSLVGFLLGVLAGVVVGGLAYRYFHGIGRGM